MESGVRLQCLSACALIVRRNDPATQANKRRYNNHTYWEVGMPDLDRLAALRDRVAVVGVGETDYVEDYARSRRGEAAHDSYGLGALAFRRALAESGLAKDAIDGLVVGPTIAYERTAEILGLNPRWGSQSDAGMSIQSAVLAITSGLCQTTTTSPTSTTRRGA